MMIRSGERGVVGRAETVDVSKVIHRMYEASLLLSVGGFVLLIGPITLIFGPSTEGRFGLLPSILPVVWTAGIFLLLGWIYLGRAVWPFRSTLSSGRAMVWAYWGSVAGFAVGLLVSLSADPRSAPLFLLGLLIYIPSIYGPPVAAQAVVFLLAVRSFAKKAATLRVAGGGFLLLAIALAAIIAQAMLSASSSSMIEAQIILSLAGSTGVGYALVFFGCRHELRAQAAS